MYPIADFSLDHMMACGQALRQAGAGASSLEEAAQGVVRYLHEHRTAKDGTAACALVRLYKTHPSGELPTELQTFAQGLAGEAVAEPVRCLTLLASAGEEAAWRDRRSSEGHQAIPLANAASVAGIPMIAQLIRQLGLDVDDVIQPSADRVVLLQQKTFNVFFVGDAPGSPYIPAQEFVQEHGVRSVLGFGGPLPSGDIFTVILFSKVKLEEGVGELFKTLALNVKLALQPLEARGVFAS